jgi:hypothetical protein
MRHRGTGMNWTYGSECSAPVIAPPSRMEVRGPSVPGEVPRPMVTVEGHRAPSPHPRRFHPYPAVSRVIHVGLRVRSLHRRLMDVLRSVRHPDPAVLSGIGPLPVLLRLRRFGRVDLIHPPLIGVDPMSVGLRLLWCLSLNLGLGLAFLRRRRLFRRSGRRLSGWRGRGLNRDLGRQLGLRLSGSRLGQQGD